MLFGVLVVNSLTLPRWVGFLLLAGFVAYAILSIKLSNPEEAEEVESLDNVMKVPVALIILVVSAAGLFLGANLLVDNGQVLALDYLHVPERVVAVTMIALGTSLPELVTTLTSAIKGREDVGLGNIIGANLFNLVLVSGLSTTLSPYEVPAGKTIFGVNASLALDIPLCFLVMALLALPALKKEKVMRWQGIVLLVIYAAYIAFQFFF